MSLFQWGVHLGAWIPIIRMVVDYLRDNLTANPIQDITFRTGKAALVLLVLSLAVTPINTIFGYRSILKIRRTLGLYAFFYVVIHFFIFVGVDYGFNWDLLQEAIFEKRFALVGFAAGLILLPLALTSTRGWMRRLGRNWKRLHRLVYLASILAVIHYVWLVKSDVRQPLFFGGVVLLLLIMRIPGIRRFFTGFRSKYLERFPVTRNGEVGFKHRPPISRKM